MNAEKLHSKFVLFLKENGLKVDLYHDIEAILKSLQIKTLALSVLDKDPTSKHPFALAAEALRVIENAESAEKDASEKANLRKLHSYLQGHETGLNWKESYIPGGPMTYGHRQGDTPVMTKIVEESIIHSKAWHLGFREGNQKSETNKIAK